jgi:DDE family transposase
MVDLDTFLVILYVMVDDFCKTHLPPDRHPGPAAALSRSEVITVALLSQWAPFGSERGFYRSAHRHLRAAFPHLPDRSHLNRLLRAQHDAIVAFGHHLADVLGARAAAYEALDGSAVPVRNVKRRGRGWLAGDVDIGWSNRLGWYAGFHLLLAVSPAGVVTGYGVAPASTKEQPLAETFFAVRHTPDPRCPSIGQPSGEPYVADNGFTGAARRRHWLADYGARVICPPQRRHPQPWPPALRRWLAHLRQIVETVFDKLHHTFRLAAKVALHTFCCWLNAHLGRALLAFADLIAW